MATNIINKENEALFLIRRYQANYTVGASTVVGVTGNDMGFTANPDGYTAVGIRSFDAQNNNVCFRYISVGGRGTSTVFVIKNLTSSPQSGICGVEILFARDDVIGS